MKKRLLFAGPAESVKKSSPPCRTDCFLVDTLGLDPRSLSRVKRAL